MEYRLTDKYNIDIYDTFENIDVKVILKWLPKSTK